MDGIDKKRTRRFGPEIRTQNPNTEPNTEPNEEPNEEPNPEPNPENEPRTEHELRTENVEP
jgi:hypothetical protein